MLRTKLQKKSESSNSDTRFFDNLFAIAAPGFILATPCVETCREVNRYVVVQYAHCRHLGVMAMNISKFMPGIGRESTERYSSLKRLLIAALMLRSAHLNENPLSRLMLLIKYGGSLPVSVLSFDDIV